MTANSDSERVYICIYAGWTRTRTRTLESQIQIRIRTDSERLMDVAKSGH